MPKFKLLLIMDNLLGGGAQEIVYQLCKRLDDSVFDVSVVSFHSKGVYFDKINTTGRNVTVLVPSLNPFSFLSIYIQLIRLINKQRYDVIHTFLPGGLMVAAPIAWLKGVPLVHSILSVRSQPPKWYYPVMWLFSPIIAAYIGLEEKELLEQGIPAAKVKLSEVLLDLDSAFAVSFSRSERNVHIDDEYIVLSVGRLHPDKGHEYAIRAWRDVIDRYPNARLHIVGTGPDEEHLRSLIRELNLHDSIRMLGYQKNLEDVYSKADIFLRTSINEGPNLVTLLAMASGLPIIVFKTAVPKDYITHDYTGWVVPFGEKNLSSAIIHLLGSPDIRKRLGEQASASIKVYYDGNKVVQYHNQLYVAAIQRQPAGQLPTMKEQMWPAFNPFLPFSNTGE